MQYKLRASIAVGALSFTCLPALAQGEMPTRFYAMRSGEQRNLSRHVCFRSVVNCEPGPCDITVLKNPSMGRITPKKVMLPMPANFMLSSGRLVPEWCVGRIFPAVSIFYRANERSSGTDWFVLRNRTPGSSFERRYVIRLQPY
jgi:hypothetical protein